LRARLMVRQRRPFWRRFRRQPDAARGVYLYGPVGRGKTLLMDLCFDSLPFPQRRRSHFHHFMRDVHERLRRFARQREPLAAVARQLAADLRVLCLDELFVSDIADAMILGGLFQALLDRGVTLVITSNAAPAGLYPNGLQRSRFLPTIALLERALEQCPLDGGTDYRLQQLQRAPIYLDSHAADSAARMQQLFRELAGEPGIQRSLQLLGRPVPVVAAHADVVWFEFAVICEGARNQNDYVELAEEFRTVLVGNIPRFELPEQDDAARRLIALVDEFYDQGTKLIVSAAAAPSELYRHGRLHAEFERTASRLVEMQSTAYLARARRG
ncbi:MAG: cell division protein ZapE, partial [Steroidobacteraceae bacterium]